MADYSGSSSFIEIWTQRLVELAANGLDEEEARTVVAEIFQEAAGTYQEALAELEAEREE